MNIFSNFTRSGKRTSWAAVFMFAVFAASSWLVLRADIPQVASGTWVAAGDVGTIPTGAASVGLADGRVLVAGGRSDGILSTAISTYNPASGAWAAAGNLAVARSGHAVTVLTDGRVLIAGGTTSTGPSFDIEIYDPASGTSAHAGDMTLARVDHAAATLKDGRVLIVGGSDGVSPLNLAEVFDPGTGQSAGVSLAMSTARVKATATTMLDGHVLVVGGSDGTNDLSSAEIFDPPTGSFFMTGPMQTARSGHAAVLLPNNNQVLIAGGTSTGAALASAELYADWRDGFWGTPNSMSAARAGAIAGGLQPYDLALVAGGGTTTGEYYGYATVQTDMEDYAPGDIVTISGSGWQPGETVALKVSEDSDTHYDWNLTAVANAQGNIINQEFYPRQDEEFQHLGMRFYVLASGAASQALTTFTDANPTSLTITPTTGSVAPGGTASYTVTVVFGGNATSCTVNLTVVPNPVTSGATAVLSASSVTGSGGNTRTVSLTIPTTNPTTLPGTYSFTVNGTPSACQNNTVRSDTDSLIVYGAATRLAFGQQPTNEVSTAPITPAVTVRVLDANDNMVANSSAPITLAIGTNPGGGVLSGTVTKNAVDGLATFNDLSIDKAANGYRLTANSGALTGATSNTFNITVGPAAKVRVETAVDGTGTVVPAQTVASGSSLTVFPIRRDAGDNFIDNVAAAWSLVNITGGVVAGDLVPAGNQRSAVFTGNAAGSAAIRASVTGLTSVDSGTLTVTAPTRSITFSAIPALSDVAASTPVLNVTIGAGPAVSVTRGELPATYSGIASGTNVSYSYLSPLVSTTDKQYRWLSTAGTGSASGQTGQAGGPFALTATSTVTATYKAQYLQTFAQTGLTGDATGTVVTVDAVAKTFADLSFSKFVDDGATVSYSFIDPVTSSVAGKRYRRSSVTGPPTGYTVSAANTVTGNYVAQWLLTLAVTAGVPGGVTNITGGTTGTFYDAGTALSLSAATPVADVVGKRWQFANWTGDVSSPPNTSNPVSVTMDQARSITANYTAQYKLTLAITAGVPGGLTRISGGADGTFYNDGTILSLAAETPVADGAGKQWRFASWSGDATGSTTPVSVTMNAAKSVTANYLAQYSVTFTQTGIGADTSATVLTITNPISATKTAAQLASYSEWFDAGSNVVYSYAANVSTDPVSGKRYALTSTTPPSPINSLAAAATVNGAYKTQYQVTFSQSGIGGDTTATVLTITSPINASKTASDLASYNEWFDAASTVAYSYTATVNTDPVSGKRYALDSTTPPSPINNLAAAATVTGAYRTQYEITFTQSGIGTDTGTNTVVTVGASAKTAGDLSFNEWFDAGTAVTYAYESFVNTSPASTKRYRLTSVTGLVSGAAVNAASVITGNYVIQWELTFAQMGIGADTGANTVVTIGVTPKAAGALPFSDWFDDGSAVTYGYTQFVDTDPTSSKRYRRTSVTGIASGTTVTAASTITGNYIVQWAQTFAQTGLSGDATGTVVTVQAAAKVFTDLPFTTFVDTGTAVAYAYTDPVTSSVTGKKYRLDVVAGPTTGYTVSGANTITGTYKAQYLLTLAMTAGVPGGLTNISGATTGTFYDEGTALTLTALTPVADGVGKRWRFDNWSGDAPSAPNTNNPLSVTMDQPRAITANYVVQWQLTLAVTAGVPGGPAANISGGMSGNFYDTGTLLTLTGATPVADGPGKQWRFNNWTGDVVPSPTGTNPVSVTMNAAKSVTANYIVQWQLTLAITAGVPGGLANITGGANGTFYDTGTSLSLTAATPVADGATKQWRFANWTGDVVSPPSASNPVSVTMNAPKAVTANYVEQYLITFTQSGITENTGPHTVVTVDGVPKTRADLAAGVSKFVDVNGQIAYAFSTPISTDPISDHQFELSNAASLPATPVTVTGPMTITGQYTLNTYSILYLQPIDQSTGSAYVINAGKNGRVIPVKVQVFKNGTAIQSGNVLMGVRATGCSAGAPTDVVTEYADAGNSNGGTNLFRWNNDFWIYNLDTRALGLTTGACYRLDVFLNTTTGPTAVLLSHSTWAIFRPVK